MNENLALRQERAEILRNAKALSQKGKLNPNEQREFDRLMREAARLKDEYERAERGRVAAVLGGGLISDPNTDDSRALIEPASSYFAPPAENRQQREYREAFRNYLRFGVAGMDERQRAILKRDMGTGGQGAYPGASTGFFTPVGFIYEVEKALRYYGPMLDVSTILRTDMGNPLPYPTSNDTTVYGELVGENQPVSAQDVSIGNIMFGAYKYSTKLVKISMELNQDSAFDLERFLVEIFAVRLGRILNNHLTVGTGSNQPEGILTAALAGGRYVNAVGTASNDGTSAGPNTIGSDDLVALEHAVDPWYRAGARWLMHDSTLRAIKQVKDKFGHPLWLDSTRDGQPATILGYPYAINNDLDQLPSGPSSPPVTRNVMLFGQTSKYIVRIVREMSVLRLVERFAEYGQIALVGFMRVDGQLLDAGTHPLAVMKSTY